MQGDIIRKQNKKIAPGLANITSCFLLQTCKLTIDHHLMQLGVRMEGVLNVLAFQMEHNNRNTCAK